MLDLDSAAQLRLGRRRRGFTRAEERVHRTQSTVSQQIKRLEDDVGHLLLNRNGKHGRPDRRRRAAAVLQPRRSCSRSPRKARDVLSQPDSEGAIRLGILEDFAALPADQTAGRRVRAPASGAAALDTSAPTRASTCRRDSRTRRPRSGFAAQARGRRRSGRHRGVAGAGAPGDQQDRPSRSRGCLPCR